MTNCITPAYAGIQTRAAQRLWPRDPGFRRGDEVVFARRLRGEIGGSSQLGWRALGRIFVSQTVLQPVGLFLLPLSFLAMLPFGWVYAFQQSATVLAADETPGIRAMVAKPGR